MKTNTSDLPKLLGRVLSAGLVPYVVGSPGTAKSASIQQLANTANLELIDVRLSMLSPTSLQGFGRINTDKNKSEFLPFDIFPTEGDPLPEGKDGWIIFFDELPSAAPSVIKACYKIILDRMVGNHKLHDDVYMIAAGNRATDGAMVGNIGTAMASRMIHLDVELDSDTWLKWAAKSGIDYRVQAYVNFKPSIVNSFDPNNKHATFACGRTLEFASSLIKDRETLDYDDRILIDGALGEGTGTEFFSFCSIFGDLPTIKEIKADPTNARMSATPNFYLGVGAYVAEHITEDNITPLMKYIERMPAEYQVMVARMIAGKSPELIEDASIQALITRTAHLMA